MAQRTLLVIGGGSIGERHVRCFQQTGRVDVSLCEINPRVRDKLAERYQLTSTFDDFEPALASRPIAAAVCTPAHVHVEMASRLADAGIHLLIEKPLSTKLDGVERLRDLVAQRGVVVGVAYVFRSHPVLSAMREVICEERFGRPVQLIAVAGQHFPHYRPAYREIYYTRRETGGGAVQDALTHLVNASEWLLGPVTAVAADASHQVLDGVDVEDTVHVLARHQYAVGRSVPANYSLNQHQAPHELTITVVCEQGTVRFEMHENRWRWMTEPGGVWHDESFPSFERDKLFVDQADAFLEAVEGSRPPICSLDEGIQTLRVNLAVLQAAETETWQTVGP